VAFFLSANPRLPPHLLRPELFQLTFVPTDFLLWLALPSLPLGIDLRKETPTWPCHPRWSRSGRKDMRHAVLHPIIGV
jgi:hypothetical protein